MFATACGGIDQDWANRAKEAADSPVGNTGEPNVGITAEQLLERVSEADHAARSVRTDFTGHFYGVPVHGDTSVTENGDIESHLTVKDREIHVLVVGDTEYTRMEEGTNKVLIDMIAKAPGYDPELEEPSESFVEFGKLLEGKYLKDEAVSRGTGLPSFDAILGGGPFTNGDDSAGENPDGDFGEDEYGGGYGDDVEHQLGDALHIDGIEVIPLVLTNRTRDLTSVLTMYVPTHGTPLPVRMTSDDDNDGKVDASVDTHYRAVAPDRTVTAPDGDRTVDMDTIMEDFFGSPGDGDGPDGPEDYGTDEDDEDDGGPVRA
ncbi:hypothetical protein [Streptodolium elevatio]